MKSKLNVLFLFLLSIIAVNTACTDSYAGDDIQTMSQIEARAKKNRVTTIPLDTTKTTTTTTTTSTSTTSSSIIFEDNFDQTNGLPDASKWSLCTPISTVNWARYLSGSNNQAYVKNSNLILTAEKVNGVYQCGGVRTLGKVEFTYGKVEVRARFKSVQGGWPGIWMMPVNQSNGWPKDGEVDIMEEVSNESNAYMTIHSNYIENLRNYTPNYQFMSPFIVNGYNTYCTNWTSEKIEFYINGKLIASYPNLHLSNESTVMQWPFNKPFYLILNFSLGGANTWPGAIDDTQLPGYMEVDWVKVTKTQ
ncbi:glycoside hydrolase family 16 protein [uncultured Bacteroides sp.]|uniref:glycoside hydrolase family 16 protein n=1 Tax=uncultured Bacteroides sp. TaxID=162156 RepID=UPI002AAC3F8F|nr:glycoside hydrolase family 16 protein [uncultured Bacteroides sp.]